jgi:hypothetical protein
MIVKEDELNRIRIALDESNYYRKQQEEILSTSRIDQRVYSVDQSPTKKSLYNRIKSAPNFGGIQRKVKRKTLIHMKLIKYILQDQSIQPRNIHSSPAAFDMEYVVDRFHGRSLAIAHSQEELEELNEDSLSDDKLVEIRVFFPGLIIIIFTTLFLFRKLVRQGTYRVRKSRMIPSILQQDEALQSLTQSTMTKQKLIEAATRKVKAAETNAHDLSINIQ